MKLINIDKSNVKYREYIMKKAALIKIVAFLGMLLIGAVVSLIIPIRPVKSNVEKRNLAKFPGFNIQSFIDGEYFAGIDTWFSDTFPGRDSLMGCNEFITNLYGIRNNVVHGEIIVGDDIPDVEFDENEYEYINNIDTESKPTDTEVKNENDKENDKENANNNYSFDNSITIDPSEIGNNVDFDENSTSASAKAGESLGSVFVVGDSAYNYYSFSQAISDQYVALINGLAKELEGSADVYDLIIPTAIDITLDDATRNSISSSNQKQAIRYMYSKMSPNVGKCYIYELMRKHRDEYLYFRTDHHWTSLGAYYAYTAFATQLEKKPYALDSFKKYEMGRFIGSYYTTTRVSSLTENPDNLVAYGPFSTNALEMVNKDNQFIDYNIITDVSGWNENSKYSSFIGGDNPYTHIKNPNLSDGSSVLVIKESFGNAFVPFLVENFEHVYVIDYRYYDGTVQELVAQNAIANVVFVNNISITSTEDRVNELKKVCGQK